MSSQLARLIGLSVFAFALVIAAAAQATPTVTITPAAGEAERAVFTIEIDGVQPDIRYTVEIVFQGEVVFSSEEKSDQAGHIFYPISSTAGDQPGLYTLRVVLDSQVIASADFLLTEAKTTPAEAPEGEYPGAVTVSPATAPFGKTQTLRITQLEPRTAYTVEIIASETLELAYRRQLASDAAGAIEVEIFAEEGDAPGLHTVAAYDAGGALAALGEYFVLEPPQRDVSLSLAPAAASAGDSVDIELSGLAAFDGVTAQITRADGVLIDTVVARASSDGGLRLAYLVPTDLADGEYAVDIFVEGKSLASASLTVGEIVRGAGAAVAIDPPAGPIGARHTIAVSGLRANQEFTLVILDPAGAVEYSAERQADADGGFDLTISSTDEDELGLYSVEIRAEASGDLLSSATFEISAADAPDDAPAEAAAEVDAPAPREASATIEPRSATIGSSHLISVRGLDANETVTIDVRFAGATVYATEKTADASGNVTLELVTGDEDQPGDYHVSVLRQRGAAPSVILTATAKPATSAGDARVISRRLVDGRATIEFEGAAGQYVLITVAADDFDPSATLIDRDGEELAFNDDSRGTKDARIGPLQLPYSGEYDLEIGAAPLMMAQGAESGEFSVSIAPVDPSPIAFDADIRFALSADKPALYYALPVDTGDSLTVTIEGGGLDTLLQVVSPTGTEMAFDDDSGSGFDAELSQLVFDRAATYVLVIASFDGASGAGSVKVARNPVRSLDDGAAIVRLNDKAIRDLVIFDAAEDELLVLHLDVVSGDVEDLYVTATVEGMEVMSYSTMGVPDELPLAFVMPMGGRVVVTLEKFGYDDGIALEVSLERP